jgi:SAM-dependent methyltransferase
MSDVSHYNPTERFSGLADTYAQHRPGYPDAALAYIIQCCGLWSTSRLVDVGCGTGISSRLFAARGIPVVGIEPNDEMRGRAEAEAFPAGLPAPKYRKGTAEATGLPDNFADVVLAAQAFHWFKADEALREFHRILRPHGHVALIWNERDERDECTAAFGKVMRSGPGACALEVQRGSAGEALLHHSLYIEATRVAFANEQALDEQGLLGRAFSASYAPREPAAAERFAGALGDVFTRFANAGKVVLRYETSVFVARRKGKP